MACVNAVMETPTTDSIPRPWEGLRRRILSAIVLAGLVVGAEILGGVFFTTIVMLMAMQLSTEFYRMTESWTRKWRTIGFFYIAIPCVSLIVLRDAVFANDSNGGMQAVLLLMAMIAATDIGAFFFGRLIGGPKILPAISPKKTWAGLLGGIICAALVGALAIPYLPVPVPLPLMILAGAVMAIVAQIGDFFESWLKRRAGIKDSGTLIPGHGGLLDRLDGFMFTAPLFTLILFISGLATL